MFKNERTVSYQKKGLGRRLCVCVGERERERGWGGVGRKIDRIE